MRNTKSSLLFSGIAAFVLLLVPAVTLAYANGFGNNGSSLLMQGLGHPMGAPVVSGTVAAINGTTLTVNGADGKTYAVDASHAKLAEGMFGSSLTIASIQVGDAVKVLGSIEGSNVTATLIHDRSLHGRNIFMGKVTAVSNTTITIVGKNNATSTVDASAATITNGRNGTTSTISDIAVGDHLKIVGTADGTTITATTIRDFGSYPGKRFGHHGRNFGAHMNMHGGFGWR